MDGHPPVPGEGAGDRIPPIDRLTVNQPSDQHFYPSPGRSGPAKGTKMAQTDYVLPSPGTPWPSAHAPPGRGVIPHRGPESRVTCRGGWTGRVPWGILFRWWQRVAAWGNVAQIVWNALVIAPMPRGRCASRCRTQEEVPPRLAKQGPLDCRSRHRRWRHLRLRHSRGCCLGSRGSDPWRYRPKKTGIEDGSPVKVERTYCLGGI